MLSVHRVTKNASSKRKSSDNMIEKWIENLKSGQCISEADLKRLCSLVTLKFFCDIVIHIVIRPGKGYPHGGG